MKQRVMVSMLVIVFSLASVAGGTMAWFSAEAELENTFIAGTLTIEADETVSWTEEKPVGPRGNWNPGDCDWKEFEITNTGSKGVILRAQFSGSWNNADLSDGNVTTTAVGTEWVKIGDWYYFIGDIDGSHDESDIDKRKVTFKVNVCLDGLGTTNLYQGETYTLTANFEAIQRTHEAVLDIWGVGYILGNWYSVTYDVAAARWEAEVNGDLYYWVRDGFLGGSWVTD